MAKDYARSKIKPSMRKSKKRNHESRLWLLVCVLAGLFILGLFYLKLQKSNLVHQPVTTVSPQTGRSAIKSPAPASPPASQPQFDFYTMLPNGNKSTPGQLNSQTTPAPKAASSIQSSQPEPSAMPSSTGSASKDETAVRTAAPKNTASSNAPSTSDEVAELEKQQLAEESGSAVAQPKSYMVQLAVFHSTNAAEQFKAQMAMMGLEVKIKTVTKNGNTGYHVLMGPFRSKTEASAAQQQLKNNQISPGVIRQSD